MTRHPRAQGLSFASALLGVLLVSQSFLCASESALESLASRDETYIVPVSRLSDGATDSEVLTLRLFHEPLVPVGNTRGGEKEEAAFVGAINAFADSVERSAPDAMILEKFCREFPESRWRASLEFNLGEMRFLEGRFQRCMAHYLESAQLARESAGPARNLADRALAAYARMHARIGRHREASESLKEIARRSPSGRAYAESTFLNDAVALMSGGPGEWFKCGPYALANCRQALGLTPVVTPQIAAAQSGDTGFSIAEVARMARDAGMKTTAVRGSDISRLPVPSVVHLKLDHFTAVVERNADGSRFRLVDPTFGFDGWVSAGALAEEASGTFLVMGSTPKGFYALDESQAGKVFGRGYTNSQEPNRTGAGDTQCPTGDCEDKAMVQSTVHAMLVSLRVFDTPVGYAPPVGPSVFVQVFKHERETIQAANSYESGFGNSWRHNWHAYIEIPTGSSSATIFTRGGGAETHSKNGTVWLPSPRSGSKLVPSGAGFWRDMPDGTRELYGRVRTTATGTLYLLTSVADSANNRAYVYYHADDRINYLADEFSERTYFRYQHPTNPKLVTSIDDPFGRTAYFSYNANGLLETITDVIGIQSTMAYDTYGRVSSFTTPYGTTSFARDQQVPNLQAPLNPNPTRFIETTNPLGQTERVEFLHSTPNLPASDPAGDVPELIIPVGASTGNFLVSNDHLDGFNSFYWDRKQFKPIVDQRGPGSTEVSAADYPKATIYHWIRDNNVATGTLASIKRPDSLRTWFNYPGQSVQSSRGSSDFPSKIARRTSSGGPTELTQIERNSLFNPTKFIDPMGREYQIGYATNQIDATSLHRKKAGGGLDLLWEALYNTNHKPTWIDDAANDRTSIAWNGRGQPTSITARDGGITTITYLTTGNGRGQISTIKLPKVQLNDRIITFTYDSNHRMRTRNVDGYTLTYDYDNLDRVTRITHPDGTYEEFTYNRLDLHTHRDRLGRITTYQHNAIQELVSITDPLNRLTQLEWCRCGSLQKLIDPANQTTRWVYDANGRLMEKIFDDASKITYLYETGRSLLQSETDAMNRTKTYSYTLDGRLSGITYSGGNVTTPAVTVSWDPFAPRLSSMTDGTGTQTWAYHPVGSGIAGADRLASVDLPGPSDTISYGYDTMMRVASRSIQGAYPTTTGFQFDKQNRLSAVTGPLAATYKYIEPTFGIAPSRLETITIGTLEKFFAYPTNNDPSRPASFRRISTTNFTLLASSSTPSDVIGRITSQSRSQGGNPNFLTFGYEYDNADQLKRSNINGAINMDNRYFYDDAGNFAEWHQGIGGGVTNYHDYTGDNTNFTTSITRGTSPNPTGSFLSMSRDGAGNLVSWADATTGQSETLTWDHENRVVKVVQQPGNKEWNMTYDGFSRMATIEEKANGSTISHRRLIWSNLEIIEERDLSDPTRAVVKYYPEGEEQWNGSTYQSIVHFRDHLGSVIETFTTNGTRLSDRRFDEYGRMTGTAPGTAGASRLTYTGHYQIPGLHYAIAPFRFYSPMLRTWLSRDPIGEEGGINLYGYVSNNPVNLVDPMGLMSKCDWENLYEDYLTQFLNSIAVQRAAATAMAWAPPTLYPAQAMIFAGATGTAIGSGLGMAMSAAGAGLSN